MRVSLLNCLRQHIQGAFDCIDVPAGSRLRDVEERVVDLVRAGGLPKRECRIWLEHAGALGIDLEHFLPQDGIGTDRKTAFRSDCIGADGKLHDYMVAIDRKSLHFADIYPSDANFIAL